MLLEEAIKQNKIQPGQTIRVKPNHEEYTWWFVGKVSHVTINKDFGGFDVHLSKCTDNDGNTYYKDSKFMTGLSSYKLLRINGRFA